MNNTTITLEDVLNTLSQMEYVSDESLERFEKHIWEHGIDDETLGLFSELLAEEIRERDYEIAAGGEMVSGIDAEVNALEPSVIEDLQKMQVMVQETFQNIGNKAEQAYNQIASDTFTAIQEDQKVQDNEKADEVKKYIGL